MQDKKILIIGVGGVGGYFGGKLAQKYDVTFFARGDTFQSLRENGLKVDCADGDFHLDNVKVTDQYDEIYDLVIICVKAPQLRDVTDAMKAAIGVNTLILPLLNGVDAVIHLKEKYGERVLGGLCRVLSSKIGPSHIKTISKGGSIDIGEVGAEISPRIRDVYELIKSAGIYITMNDDFLKAQWEKMVLISSISSVDSVTRSTFGKLREIPETRAMLKQSMIEIIDVAKALSVDIEYDFANKMIVGVDSLPADSTSSLHKDIKRGNQSELDYLIGSVVKHGIEQGVDIPLSKFLYYSLLPQELASRN